VNAKTSAKKKVATIAKVAKVAKNPEGKEWWEAGVRFECQGSGRCCVSRGEYGFVYMTRFDRQRMAKAMGLTTSAFTRRYCARSDDGIWHLKDGSGPDCLFLKDKQCSVYEGRPDQCRTWPFWPEVMNAKTWKREVAAYCPGVGRGRTYSAQEIREIVATQRRSEVALVQESKAQRSHRRQHQHQR